MQQEKLKDSFQSVLKDYQKTQKVSSAVEECSRR